MNVDVFLPVKMLLVPRFAYAQSSLSLVKADQNTTKLRRMVPTLKSSNSGTVPHCPGGKAQHRLELFGAPGMHMVS